MITIYKLLIVDDNNKDRRIVREIVDWESLNIEVAGEASNGKTALEILAKRHIDIMITDVSMPVMDGIIMVNEAKRMYPSLRVIFMSFYEDFKYAKSAIKAGSFGYILKPIRKDELTESVNLVLDTIAREEKDKFEKVELSKRVDETIPVMKENLFRDMIFGVQTNPEKIYAKMQLLNIDEASCQNAQILCVKINYLESDTTMKDRNPIMNPFENFFELACPNNGANNGETLSLIQTGTNEHILIRTVINEDDSLQYAKFLYDVVKMKTNADVSIGVSLIAPLIGGATELYRQALSALTTNYSMGEVPILLYSDSRDANLVKDVKEIIRKEYADQITVAYISERVYMSSRQLNTIFKRMTGLTVFQYMINYRMNMAKQLLSAPDAMIYEVCEQVGYTNKSYFTMLFKNTIGQTPKEYRSRMGLHVDVE